MPELEQGQRGIASCLCFRRHDVWCVVDAMIRVGTWHRIDLLTLMEGNMKAHFAPICCAWLTATLPVSAAETPGRFTMSPTEGGFVRLDTQSGAMALCTRKDADWSCSDMPESADASRKRIEALESENKMLKDEMKRMDDVLGHGSSGSEPAAPKSFSLPDEKDVDKAFDYLEAIIKKFRERAKKLEEQEGGAPGTPL